MLGLVLAENIKLEVAAVVFLVCSGIFVVALLTTVEAIDVILDTW